MSNQIQNTPIPSPQTPTITPLPDPVAASAPGSAQFQRPEQTFSAFGSISQFKDAQRMATMLARSSIVPVTYRGDDHIGDCVIALEIANRIGASVLAVMQNLYRVEGRLGWSSQFLISCVNATKRFSPIRYQMTGQREDDSWGCIAWAIDKTGEALRSPEVTLKMAKEEGWYDRPGSKWKTMPQLMLCYRSATLFTRLYAPEIAMGIQTAEEVVDMGPEEKGSINRPIFEVTSPKPKCQPRFKAQVHRDIPMEFAPPHLFAVDKLGETQAPVAPTGTEPSPNLSTNHYNYLKALTGLIGLSDHSEADVLRFLRNSRKCEPSLASLAEAADQQPSAIVWAHDSWAAVNREISRLKKDQAI